MKKVTKLVTVTLQAMVIVDVNSSEFSLIESSKKVFINKIKNDGLHEGKFKINLINCSDLDLEKKT